MKELRRCVGDGVTKGGLRKKKALREMKLITMGRKGKVLSPEKM